MTETVRSEHHIEVPTWVKQGALYHVYPLSFCDSNGDGYGDIPGIISKLDYIESLGVTAIWLSPVYESPMVDFGYDVSDFKHIDPRFGTMRDMDYLIREVHARGMKILMDYVPNHTSIEHEWFKKSRSNRHNDKHDWYIWADAKPNGAPPNNWLSRFGGSGWEWDERRKQYYLHSYLPQQADLNWHNPFVREAMLDVLRFWLGRGVDGFRTDAARSIAKDPLLRDDTPNPGYRPGKDDPAHALLTTYSRGYAKMGDSMDAICEVVSERDDTFLVSEAYLGISELHEMYDSCRRHPIHAPLNFNFIILPWKAAAFRDFIETYQESLGPNDWPNYVLSTHDRHRVATRVGAKGARLLAMLQLTLKGLPVVYYGDELGLPDSVVAPKSIRDPWGIRVPGLDFGRDPERGPMPWTAGTKGGFSRGKPWLPLAEGHAELSVESQDKDPNSSLNLYRRLIKLRLDSPALEAGDYVAHDAGNPEVYSFMRQAEGQTYLITLNFSHRSTEISFPKGKYKLVVSTTTNKIPMVAEEKTSKLKPFEGRLYVKES